MAPRGPSRKLALRWPTENLPPIKTLGPRRGLPGGIPIPSATLAQLLRALAIREDLLGDCVAGKREHCCCKPSYLQADADRNSVSRNRLTHGSSGDSSGEADVCPSMVDCSLWVPSPRGPGLEPSASQDSQSLRCRQGCNGSVVRCAGLSFQPFVARGGCWPGKLQSTRRLSSVKCEGERPARMIFSWLAAESPFRAYNRESFCSTCSQRMEGVAPDPPPATLHLGIPFQICISSSKEFPAVGSLSSSRQLDQMLDIQYSIFNLSSK